jgi:hypothetical protein
LKVAYGLIVFSQEQTMSDDLRSLSYPVASPHVGGLSESVAAYDPGTSSLADAALKIEIDAILQRLRIGMPTLHREMDELLVRLREPVTA